MLAAALPAIRFFEAVARHQSVKLAAEELHVTPGAVSQQVRKLESLLGRPLFERRARGLTLTQAGRDYLAACQEALSVLRRATEKLLHDGRRTLLVSCTPMFGLQWLIPRLNGFMQEAPHIDVHVSTSVRLVDLAAENVDFAIRHGLGRYPGLKSIELITDDLVPVCSPSLVAPRRTARLEDIESRLLLHDAQREDWKLWCRAAGARGIDCEQGVVCVDSNGVIEAALAGRGYALVRRAFVREELASRRLLLVKAPALRAPIAYHLVYRAETLADPAARAFFDWILAQAGVTQARPRGAA